MKTKAAPPQNAALSALYTADEQGLVQKLASHAEQSLGNRTSISDRAATWVNQVRASKQRIGMIDAFLQEYGLSTPEGVILMRLSEALIRTPDFATAQELMRDKLVEGQWALHAGLSPTTMVNAATAGLRFSTAWIEATGGNAAAKLAAKLGDRVLHAAVVRGMGIMAQHFVLGRSIEDAVERASRSDKDSALYSFDMLGEGACTQADAQRYFDAYQGAIRHLASIAGKNDSVATAHGLSVKLSALHPRYEYANRADCVPILVEKVRCLGLIAKEAGIGLTLDAEEADRLEVSLQIFSALLDDPELGDWDGLGIVIQAYQRRATATIDFVVAAAAKAQRQIAVRLVKGAYWDAEIKRAQELGLESYPVFTRKEHTDISYLACAGKLLKAGKHVFPQFATHNAHTAAAILDMADGGQALEFQRLHGMGEALHAQICAQTRYKSRVYAPVGGHKELLPYLVRRLLENGANSSFVNQLMNLDIEVEEIVADPILVAGEHGFTPHPAIPAPCDMFDGQRMSAKGLDLTQSTLAVTAEALLPLPVPYRGASIIDGQDCGGAEVSVYNPARLDQIVGHTRLAALADIEAAVRAAQSSDWSTNFTPQMRAACLLTAADAMEEQMPELMALCVSEAGKTLPDSVAEIREAIDFCRYYASQAVLPAMLDRAALGVIACISPWNFPLAIFIGQVVAAVVAGNKVVAKPAAQTPLIAHAATRILLEAGVPKDALHLVVGDGDVGAALVGHRGVDGVCFTGSTPTAQRIAQTRAAIGRADSVLIAETGGINAMVVDSTALLEQAVGDVLASAFQSAGQRCSACRLVCVQDDIAPQFEKMLAGALALLSLGDPAILATDVGPIIDQAALARIADYVANARKHFRIIGEAPIPPSTDQGHFIAPIAIAINKIADLDAEVFGPVLHVARFGAQDIHNVIDQINALGFGLTMGLHSRIDSRIQAIAETAKVGNLYVNRNQIGAVVGVQPFGGEGLSGTGPKAGGSHYLLRLSRKGPIPATGARMPLDGGQKETSPALAGVIGKARDAQKVWVGGDRVKICNLIAQALDAPDFVGNNTAVRLLALESKVKLPGPTGEENSLRLVPRGVLLCCGGDRAGSLARQVAVTLGAGSAVLMLSSKQAEAIQTQVQPILTKEGMSQSLIALIAQADLGAALNSAIDGVVADGSQREDLAQILATRSGAIIPLLASDDDHYRYFHERTLTIDTTAAGGNASLLAMQATH